jgi:hypothetical protein
MKKEEPKVTTKHSIEEQQQQHRSFDATSLGHTNGQTTTSERPTSVSAPAPVAVEPPSFFQDESNPQQGTVTGTGTGIQPPPPPQLPRQSSQSTFVPTAISTITAQPRDRIHRNNTNANANTTSVTTTTTTTTTKIPLTIKDERKLFVGGLPSDGTYKFL